MNSSRRRLVRLAPAALILALGGIATSGAVGATDTTVPAPSTAAGTAPAADPKAELAALLQRPTSIGSQAKLGTAAPTGKKVDWIQCSVPACIALGKPLQAAMDALGWQLKIISHDGSVEGVKNAWAEAVRDAPDAVVSSGYPRAVFETELAELKAKNTPVVLLTVTDAPGDGLTAVVNGPKRNAEVGRQMALFTANDSNGAANALWVTTAFPILAPTLDGVDGVGGFKPTMASLCEKCRVDVLDIPIEALAKDAPQRIVSYLQAHPDINYLVGSFGDIVAAMPGALADAGLKDKVKIVTYSQNETLTASLKNKEIAAVIGFPGPEDMWQIADVLVRHFAGADHPTQFDDLPSWIITPDNVPDSTEFYPLVADYQAQYKALWGVS